MLRTLSTILLLVASTTQICCVGAGAAGPRAAHAPIANPIFVAGTNHEAIWERTVDVLHDYRFDIARENKLDGVIETDYKVGSSVLEPWHQETIGHDNRWESTFQSIRRRALVSIVPAEGGFLVSTEVFQELEDVRGVAANSAGGATFQESTPLQRDLELVVGQSTPSGWLPQGRDSVLEQDMLHRLNAALSR
jgi:hypothetical protein